MVNMRLLGHGWISRCEFYHLLYRDIHANGNEIFAQIRSNVNGRVRLALHGTNGFKPDLMKACVKAGVSKINVN